MKTSGTYNFQELSVEALIREAFERIGIGGEKTVPVMLESARRSINFIQLSWMNKTTNLWTLDTKFLPLTQNQGQYPLDNKVGGVVQVMLRTSNRVLDGTATSSSGGNADSAFDGNALTHCLQLASNGTISYQYRAAQTITFIGICSFSKRDYTLEIGNIDSFGENNPLLSLPKQTFLPLVTYWFALLSPSSSLKYYVKETGGSVLDIAEIYFNNQTSDLMLSEVSRYDYYSYPQKSLQGRPSVFYLDKKANPNVPTLFVWPTPDAYSSKGVLFFTYKKMMQDASSFSDSLSVPALFYPALTAELAYRLSVKYSPELAPALKEDALREFLEASEDNSENTPISIIPNWRER